MCSFVTFSQHWVDGFQMKEERKEFNKQRSVEQTAHSLVNNDLAALLTQDYLHV